MRNSPPGISRGTDLAKRNLNYICLAISHELSRSAKLDARIDIFHKENDEQNTSKYDERCTFQFKIHDEDLNLPCLILLSVTY
jgi:hypothetical protein